jgi:UDP-N-acetylmuramate dehydrogenase
VAGGRRALADVTTARVGGFTDRFYEPESVEELTALLDCFRDVGAPFLVLGGGTNVLCADGEIREAVVSTRRLQAISWSDDGVRVEAGVPMGRLVYRSASRGLSGLEPMTGIPGTIGGAIVGNAGGRHGCIGDVLERVKVALGDGRIRWLTRDEVNPRYRRTDLDGYVVLEAVLRLRPQSTGRVLRRIADIQIQRRKTQPGGSGTMGCFFKNPAGMSAGLLIDRAGLKGASVGGVFVSDKHANFFVNHGSGTAEDFLRLGQEVQREVETKFAIRLEPEVRIWPRAAALT